MAMRHSRQSSVARFHDGGSERAGAPHPRRRPAESHHHGMPRDPGCPGFGTSPPSISCCCRPARRSRSIWANTAPESYFRTTFSLRFLVNDVLMVLFFGLDHEGGRRGHRTGRRAASLAARHTALCRRGGSHRSSRDRLCARRAALRRTAGAGRLAGGLRDRPRLRLFRCAASSSAGIPAIPFFVLLAICANAARGPRAGRGRSPASELRLETVRSLMVAAVGTVVALRRARVRSSGLTCLAPAASPGARSTPAGSNLRSPSCRSCRFFRTPHGTRGSSSRPRRPPTMR